MKQLNIASNMILYYLQPLLYVGRQIRDSHYNYVLVPGLLNYAWKPTQFPVSFDLVFRLFEKIKVD